MKFKRWQFFDQSKHLLILWHVVYKLTIIVRQVNEATLVKSEFVLQSTLGSESNSRKIPASSNIFVPFGKIGNFARFLPQDYK